MNSSFQTVGSRGTPFHAPGLSILVVDDSNAIRALMSSKIQAAARDSYRIELDTAASGEDALSQCAEKAFDLIFMDVVMPGMGGLEACKRIKTLHRTRIAMVSSLKDPDDYDAARHAGCDNYLVKPIQDVELRAVLRIVSLHKLTSR